MTFQYVKCGQFIESTRLTLTIIVWMKEWFFRGIFDETSLNVRII